MKSLRKYIEDYYDGAVYTAFDTETTGLSRVNDRIIEIGAVRFSKDGIQGIFNELIYPEKAIPVQSQQIHGISDEMLKGKPLFRDIADSFLDFIGDSQLIAHNSNFDISFVNKELENAGKPVLKSQAYRAIDTVILSRQVFPEFEKHTLQFLAARLNISSGNAHRASDDARVCMELFKHCIIRGVQKQGR